jgi:hypothetical protein
MVDILGPSISVPDGSATAGFQIMKVTQRGKAL